MQKNMKINDTSYCEGCKFCTMDDSNKAKIMMYCELDEKNRIYGAYVDCERKEEVEYAD